MRAFHSPSPHQETIDAVPKPERDPAFPFGLQHAALERCEDARSRAPRQVEARHGVARPGRVFPAQGLGAERKLVVILGGDGKGQEFGPLAAPVGRFARAVVLIGRDAPVIREVLQDAGVPLLDAGSMEEAVKVATQRAHAGDAVLMSPACASWDQFTGYDARGDRFRDLVAGIAQERAA